MSSPSVPSLQGRLLVFGAGGHGRVVVDAAMASRRWPLVLMSDRDAAKWGSQVIGDIDVVPPDQLPVDNVAVHVAIGDNASRRRESAWWGMERLASVLHPQACISGAAQIGGGVFVAAGAIIAPGAVVEMGCIVNHGAVVDHDCHVGAFSHVAPRATLGGGVRLGRGVLAGAGCVLLPGVQIADGAIIGAGAVVRRSIDEAGTYVGVPARRVR